jgi:putative permease
MNGDRFLRNLGLTILVLLAGAILYQVRSLLTPILAALLVAYVLYPIVAGAQRCGVPRKLSILLLFVGLAAAFILVMYRLLPAIRHELVVFSSPDLAAAETESKLVLIGMDISRQLQSLGLLREEWHGEDIRTMSRWIASQSEFLMRFFGGLLRQTGQFMLIFFFILVFALIDGERLYRAVVQLLPNCFFEPALFILHKSLELLGHYLRGLVVENLIVGGLSFALLLGVSSLTSLSVVVAGTVAVIIGLTNVVRIVGPIFGAVAGILLVLTVDADLWAIAGILAVVAIVQILDNVVILPAVMKEQINIHPVMCLLGVLTGGMVGGVMGMILAIPIIGGIKIVYRVFTIEMKEV